MYGYGPALKYMSAVGLSPHGVQSLYHQTFNSL